MPKKQFVILDTETTGLGYDKWNSYHGNYRWQSLSTAADYFGIDISGAHNAATDCLMTLEVVKAMAGRPG